MEDAIVQTLHARDEMQLDGRFTKHTKVTSVRYRFTFLIGFSQLSY